MNDIVEDIPNFVSRLSWQWRGIVVGEFHCHCLLGFKLFARTMVGRKMLER
jgi:hypothetical protein